MNTFHHILERAIVLCFVFCFVFVSTYIPQPWAEINKAEAGGATGGSTEFTQIMNNVQLLGVNIAATASAGYDAVTSMATNNSWLKEVQLDGIAWVLAKQMVSQMTTSIVNWINSGFNGSPSFVQDLEGFLLSVGDQAFGDYLQDLGGPLSFLCSPFQLDIRIALATTYSRARDGQPNTDQCSLTGVMANIENFSNGNFAQGGWEAWFQITSKPETYTPYGSLLTAQTEAGIRILNSKGEETKLLEFGSGFLSSRICEAVQGSGTTRENCFISTPGKVIEDALTFQLSTGPRSLIAADEINEIISALFGQLQQQAITGAAGLLGLSGGTGYTAPGYSGGSYVNQLSTSGSTLTSDPARVRALLVSARATELAYQSAANTYLPQLNAYYANVLNNATRRANAQAAAAEIPALLVRINTNLAALNNIIARYDALPTPANETAESSVERSAVMQEYISLSGLHSDVQVSGAEIRWRGLIQP